jgi:hypothetical protein
MDDEDEISILSRKEEALPAALDTFKPPTLQRPERRVECLERRDVRRPGLRDREGAHRIVQRAPEGFHLG